ncbi:Mur ligase [Russula brevipes]|nr:Mur ligase [Russula brevipes]
MSGRSYKDAIDLLNTLQSNAATLEAVKASGGQTSHLAIPEMIEYLETIGYKKEDLNSLNVIHVTGTKGKGSTCAFVDSILRHTKPEWKIGLYTSPHMVAVRERIRVNGVPISEELFAKFFFDVWDRLEESHHQICYVDGIPRVSLLEGGTYDCTNIVPRPIVTGISSLGIDHVGVLGKTIGEIAWQKGGIFKRTQEGVPAITVNQQQKGMDVLRQRSVDLKASEFIVVPPVPKISEIQIGIMGPSGRDPPDYERGTRCSTLPEIPRVKESAASQETLSDTFIEGLKAARWPGRCQTVNDPRYPPIVWFLDGAHTVESLGCCIEWFVSPVAALRPTSTGENPTRILIFNCTRGRSGHSFLETALNKIAAQLQLHASGEAPHTFFDKVVFCANVTYADGHFKGDDLKVQQELVEAWTSLVPTFPRENAYVLPSIEHAVGIAREEAVAVSRSKFSSRAVYTWLAV